MQSREIPIKLPSVTPVGKYEFNALKIPTWPWGPFLEAPGKLAPGNYRAR